MQKVLTWSLHKPAMCLCALSGVLSGVETGAGHGADQPAPALLAVFEIRIACSSEIDLHRFFSAEVACPLVCLPPDFSLSDTTTALPSR